MSLTQTYFDRIYSRFLLLICNFPLPNPQQWGACLRPSTIHYLFNTSAHVILIFFYLNSYERQIYQNTVFMYSTVPFIFNHIVSGQRNIFPKLVKSFFFPLKKLCCLLFLLFIYKDFDIFRIQFVFRYLFCKYSLLDCYLHFYFLYSDFWQEEVEIFMKSSLSNFLLWLVLFCILKYLCFSPAHKILLVKLFF